MTQKGWNVQNARVQSLFFSTALVLLLNACAKPDSGATWVAGEATSLPRVCEESEAAQRACAEHMAAVYERQWAGSRSQAMALDIRSGKVKKRTHPGVMP